MPIEQWQGIPDFPHYQVSTLGHVRSLDRTIVDVNGRVSRRKGRMIRPGRTLDGYQVVGLCIAGISWSRLVHELVAAVFHGERPEGHQVHHRNLNRSDNRSDNLVYKRTSGHLAEHFAGEANPAAKLTDERVREIKQLLDRGITQQAIAKHVGINQAVISRIKHGKAWSHVKPPVDDNLFLSFTLDSVTELAF